MKSLTRFFALFFAAILCGALLAACATAPTPPVASTTANSPSTSEPGTDNTVSDTAAPVYTDTSVNDDTVAPESTETPQTDTTAAIIEATPETTAQAEQNPGGSIEGNEPAVSNTYGKPISELLYIDSKGDICSLGTSAFYLPANGSYLYNAPNFVVGISPKMNVPSFTVWKGYDHYPVHKPESFVDDSGNTITPVYDRDYYTSAGSVVHTAEFNEEKYAITVFPDGSYNTCKLPSEVVGAEYYNENIGLAVLRNIDDEKAYDAYCTYNGGKTFEFISTITKENGNYANYLRIVATNSGKFFVAINPAEVRSSTGSVELCFEIENGKLSAPQTVKGLAGGFTANLAFDNNIGVWARVRSIFNGDHPANDNGRHFALYYITTDGGITWQRYDPAVVGVEIKNTVSP